MAGRSASNSRNRSRSRTPPRRDSRARSYTDYSDDSYDDDSFISDDGSVKGGKSKTKTANKNSSLGQKGKKGGGGARRKGGGQTSSRAQRSPRGGPNEYVTQRMLSARRIKINELKNALEDMNMQMIELKQENKILKRQAHIQNRALDRYEDQENDVSSIIQRHSEEIRVLKEQVRRQKDKYLKAEKKLKSTEDELDRTKRLLRKMKGLVEDKGLAERDRLNQRLTKMEQELEERDRKIADLERHTEHLQNNHKHEMGIERARYREKHRELQEIREKQEHIQEQLKEREKELDVRNIYSNRLMRPPHRLNSSVSSTPLPEQHKHTRNKPKEPDMTPRDRMKLYSEKRREEDKKARETSPDEAPKDEQQQQQQHQQQQQASVASQPKPSPVVSEPKFKPKPVLHTKSETVTVSHAKHVKTKNTTSSSKSFPLDSSKEEFVSNDKPTATERVFDHISEESSRPLYKQTTASSNKEPKKETNPDKNNNPLSEKANLGVSPREQKDSTPEADDNNKPYVPTFMTELRDKKKTQTSLSNDSRNDSPPLVDYSSDFKLSNKQKPKVGRRGPKPLGTTHFSLVEADRSDGNQSPVLANFTFDPKSHNTLANVHSKDHSRVSASTRERNSQPDPFRIDDSPTLEKEQDKKERRRAREEQEREEQLRWEIEEEEARKREEKARREEEEGQAEEERRIRNEKDEEERWKEERERRKRESEARKEREEMLRQEKALKEQREKEERERKEREEREREEHEELERLERERREREEKEEIERKAREERERMSRDEQEQEARRQKDLLLAKMKEIDSTKRKEPVDNSSPSSKKKDYNFKKSIENMHHGMPAYDDVKVPVLERTKKRNTFFDDDDDGGGGGYKPSFGGSSSSNKSNVKKKSIFDDDDEDDKIPNFSGPPQSQNKTKKSDLMNDLFGTNTRKPGVGKKTTNTDSNGYSPSTGPGRNQPQRFGRSREGSGTALFGGGNAIIDDDDTSVKNSSQLLPRRSKQQSTALHARPTINAVDDLEEDIEEVML